MRLDLKQILGTWSFSTPFRLGLCTSLPRYAKSEGALATLDTSYGSLVAERLFSPQPSAISGGVFSLLALSIFYLAMELWYLKVHLSCSRSGRYAYRAAYALTVSCRTPQWQTSYQTASSIAPAARVVPRHVVACPLLSPHPYTETLYPILRCASPCLITLVTRRRHSFSSYSCYH